jgi:hypothetical protein
MADLIANLQAAAGAGGGATNVQDVFATTLYTGNGSSQTITNGIDLAGEGGLIWTKRRDSDNGHAITDTVRGLGNVLFGLDTNANNALQGTLNFSASSTGYSFGPAGSSEFNLNTATYASFTFRKAPKFFDIITYSGNSTTGRQISHNLDCLPGFIIVKRTNGNKEWHVAALRADGAQYNFYQLDSPAGRYSNDVVANVATSTVIKVDNGSFANLWGGTSYINTTGENYVMYLFGHNDGGFGAGGLDNIVSCGSYTGNGSATGPTIDLGYEPQWLLIKGVNFRNWILYNSKSDTTNPRDKYFVTSLPAAEATGNDIDFTSTGFQPKSTSSSINGNTETYNYLAIRADM